VEIQSRLTDQLTEIDVHGSAEPIPTGESLRLHTLEIPEGIADILKIEVHSMLFQACTFATPVAEEVAVRPLTRFVTVRAGGRFLLRRLGMGWKCT
jgi:hypothetical protein